MDKVGTNQASKGYLRTNQGSRQQTIRGKKILISQQKITFSNNVQRMKIIFSEINWIDEHSSIHNR